MTSTVSADTRLRRGRLTPTVFLARYGFYAALLILVLVFTALSPNFLTVPNFINILQQTSTIGIMAIGQTLVILAGGIDVSVGSVLGLGGMIAAMVMREPGASPIVALVAGVLSGLAIGLLNGAIITRVGVGAFITTLATLNMARGLVYILSNQYNVDVPDGSSFFFIGRGHVQLLPVSVLIFLLLFAVAYVVERRTVLGRAIHAIGGNPAAAELSGLNVRRVRMTTSPSPAHARRWPESLSFRRSALQCRISVPEKNSIRSPRLWLAAFRSAGERAASWLARSDPSSSACCSMAWP